MRYGRIGLIITALAIIAKIAISTVEMVNDENYRKTHRNSYPLPYDRELTDSVNMQKLNDLYFKYSGDSVDFQYYELIKQANGFRIVVAINERDPDRIVKMGVPVQQKLGGAIEIEDPLSFCCSVSGCREGSYPYYNGEFSWTVSECEKSSSLYPRCVKYTYVTDGAVEEAKRLYYGTH